MADRGSRLHDGRRPGTRPRVPDTAVPEAPQGRRSGAAPAQLPRAPHCHTSLLIASGADIAVVSKLLGHASISITADVYGHLIGTVASDAVNGAANLIAHTPKGVSA
jgi:integrase